ncbi:hypothetical protein ACFL35_20595, partial [Candidatus Riflebacteria bacterium]
MRNIRNNKPLSHTFYWNLFLILLLMMLSFSGCILESEDRDNRNNNTSYQAPLTGGTLTGSTQAPSSTNPALSASIYAAISSFEGFSASLIDSGVVTAVTFLSGDGTFNFASVPLKENLKINVRKGYIHLMAIVPRAPFAGETINVTVDTRSSAAALIFEEARNQGKNLALGQILSSANSSTLNDLIFVIENVLASDTEQFSEEPLATTLNLPRVKAATAESLYTILNQTQSSTSSTSTTTSSTTTSSSANTTKRPEASFSQEDGVQKGDITFLLSLKDEDSQEVSVQTLYSIDGGNYLDATVTGLPQKIPVSSTGNLATFTWKSMTDIPDINSKIVKFKVIANDEFGPGTEFISSAFEVQNSFKRLIISDSSGKVHEISSLLGISNFVSPTALASPTGLDSDGSGGFYLLDNHLTTPSLHSISAVGQLTKLANLPAANGGFLGFAASPGSQ